MKKKKVLWCLTVLMALATAGYAQKQLVLLKGEKVLLRLSFGDEITFRMKGSKTVRVSYVNNLFDTAVMAHKDIIPFYKIDRIYFKHSSFANRVGGFLLIAGAGYFVIDQINTMVVQGHDPSLDKSVDRASIAMVAVGLPMMLIRKKSQRIGGRYRLFTANYDSPFYQHDLDHF